MTIPVQSGLKRDFKKLCYIKKEQAIPMPHRVISPLKVSTLAIGKVLKRAITRKENYRQKGSNGLRKLVSNGKNKNKVSLIGILCRNRFATYPLIDHLV
jgi:hypothetical protein